MLIKIISGIIIGLLLVYIIARVFMKGLLDELDEKINKYLPKKDDDSQSR